MKNLLHAALLFLLLMFELASAEPCVAVYVEPGFPNFGGTQSIPPGKIAGMLDAQNIPARNLSAADLADPTRLNSERVAVLILPYGNTFPVAAFENLNRFHRSGGCIVTTGIPFTQPCEKIGAAWERVKGKNVYNRKDEGIGCGGFSGPANGKLMVLSPGFQPNPLGLKDDMLGVRTGNMQWLNTGTLSADDDVISLIGLIEPGAKEPHPIASIIRHSHEEFRGAILVWLGTTASKLDEADAYLAGQLLVRSTAWCLREKSKLTTGQFDAILALMDRESPPSALPENLAYTHAPRPWGDSFLPKSKPPARRLQCVDVSTLKREERIALACLQGLTSREQPRIWLDTNPGDHFWLDWQVEKKHIDGYERVADWKTLFKQYAGAFRGAVIADSKLYRCDLLAANVAACEDLIVATPELARELGLPIQIDLRGKFTTYAEGLEWIRHTYHDKLNRHLAEYICPSWLPSGAFAYSIQWRAVMLWNVGPVDAEEKGADLFAEKRIVARIFSELEPNAAVIGFPAAQDGVGAGEVNGVALASRYAHPLVCTNFLVNACVTSGVAIPFLKQPTQPPTPVFDSGKIYIALNVSDGDNQNCWLGFFKDHFFNNKRFGEFPLAFGMGPPILDLQPARAQWYFDHAKPNTEFIADVSGIGYMHPDKYAAAFQAPSDVFDGFLDWTARYMKRLDMRTLRPVHGDDAVLTRYAEKLPGIHSVFGDMGRYSGRSGIASLTYTLPNKTPIFRSVTSWRHGKDGLLNEIREQVGITRPAFVNAFVHCWTFNDLAILAGIYDARDADMVFVTPSQLTELYRVSKTTVVK